MNRIFSKRIKELRKEFNLSQSELAKRYNIDRTTVGKWENDVSVPDIEILSDLATLFDVTVDYLIGKTNVRYHHETIAAHHENDEWTEEELKSIEDFKEYIRSKRKKSK